MRDHEVTIAAQFDLAGVLCLPTPASSGPVPAVLLLGGTGADTRDGDLVLPGDERPDAAPAPGTLRRIAHHLAGSGIASLRWDRRGFGSSGGDPAESDYLTDLADAEACMRWLHGRPDVDPDRTGVAGHSAGALTACQMCRDVPGVAAAALLGALASPIEELIRWNLDLATQHWAELTPGEQTAVAERWPAVRLGQVGIDRLLDAARGGDDVAHLEGHGLSVTVRTARLRQDLSTSYADEFRHVTCPALVLHGGDDLNVRVEDALVGYTALRRAGNDDVELVVLPGLEHYFCPVAADPARRAAERLTMQALRRPMSRRALDVIARWAVRTLSVSPSAR
ncbi:MAG TPA: alpha/beta fold hydrolase [Acidimicrobiales bacterium]|nr:alpha/beta fold hydrolase [Acidimicrobiales bacterium]